MFKVFLVEDDQFLSSILTNRLKKEGFEVTLAKDGLEAEKILIEDKMRPDLILLDVILPGKTGFELLEEVRQVPELKNTKVVITSNLGQELDIKRGQELGAEYVVKARTSLDDIINKVKEIAGK